MFLQNLHAIDVEFMAARKTHDLADSVNILFEAYGTFDLSPNISPPPFSQTVVDFLLLSG